ncbi:MAG: succinate--CoA ligase subunit alpha [Dehalococcoidia bacterium]|nr:succinate--CoA ligase subunit alpha [Dehalococcoidia bacterium]
MSILVDERTALIIQGITGREAVTMSRELLDYGSRLVGGVTPGRKGREVHGVPVEDTVRAFTERGRIDASIVAVPPAFAADAVLEAIEAGVKLIVVVTERIPRRQVAQFVEYARLHGARIIGPNCLGVISPGKAKVGGVGGAADATRRAFRPGSIGVMSRSGGMTTEIANALSEAGLGVSTAVSIGGDAVIGSTYAELMPLFEADPETRGIAIYSEPGGRAEAELADYLAAHGSRLPVVAFMAGRFMDAMPGMRFGHAGTIVEGRADTAAEKVARMEAAGIAVAERIEDIPLLLAERIEQAQHSDNGGG